MTSSSDAAGSSLTGHALYLFCVARLRLLMMIEGAGVNGNGHLQVVPFRDLMAVVSTVGTADFCGPAAEARLKDLAWLGPRACRHEAVVEWVMRSSPVLPATFATLFSSRERLHAWLARHHGAISGALDRVAGHEEWAVKGRLDKQNAEAGLLVAALERERGRLSSSPGARHLEEQRMRARVGEELDLWLEEVCEEVAAELRVHATDFRERAVLPGASVAQGIVILNWAFLVPRAIVGDFGATVRRTNRERREQGLVLEVSGPWPPYSFCPPLDTSSLA